VIYKDVTQTIGRHAVGRARAVGPAKPGRLLAKLEMRNPCGSVKDRVGLALIEDARARA